MSETSPPGACMRPTPLFLRNGSARDRPLPQVLEAQQHGQRPFKLSVEMDLVAAEPLQLVGVERLTERLLADERPVGQFLLARLEPRQHLSLQKATQSLGVGGGGLVALVQFVGISRQDIGPPLSRVISQRR